MKKLKKLRERIRYDGYFRKTLINAIARVIFIDSAAAISCSLLPIIAGNNFIAFKPIIIYAAIFLNIVVIWFAFIVLADKERRTAMLRLATMAGVFLLCLSALKLFSFVSSVSIIGWPTLIGGLICLGSAVLESGLNFGEDYHNARY